MRPCRGGDLGERGCSGFGRYYRDSQHCWPRDPIIGLIEEPPPGGFSLLGDFRYWPIADLRLGECDVRSRWQSGPVAARMLMSPFDPKLTCRVDPMLPLSEEKPTSRPRRLGGSASVDFAAFAAGNLDDAQRLVLAMHVTQCQNRVGDPMIKEPTADQLKRSPGLAKRDRGPTNGQLGGQPGEPQRGSSSGGG